MPIGDPECERDGAAQRAKHGLIGAVGNLKDLPRLKNAWLRFSERSGRNGMRTLRRAFVPAVTVVLAFALAICVDVSAKTGTADAVTTVPLKVDRLDAAAADRIHSQRRDA